MSDELLAKIPEKFRGETLEQSIEKITGSYSELERKLGERTETPKFDSRDALLQAAQVDMEALTKEWTANDGKLTDETYGKFEKLGVPKFTVDQLGYIESQQAALLNETIFAAGGGEDKTRALIEWAKANAPEPLKDEYSNAYDKRDIKAAREATAKLVAAYEQANGTAGSGEIRGGGVPSIAAIGYASYAEKAAASRAAVQGRITMDEYNRRIRASDPSVLQPPPLNTF